jgi:hypothetical protein
LTCTVCSRQFSCKAGLSQHRRQAHPSEYNNEKLERIKLSGTHWSEQECHSLLRLADVLSKSSTTRKELYSKLQSHFPNRSVTSIRLRLSILKWRENHSHAPSVSPIPEAEDSILTADTSTFSWFKSVLDSTVSTLEANPDPAIFTTDLLSLARGLQSGIMTASQVLSLLDLHARKAFPQKWDPISKRRIRLRKKVPSDKKSVRKATYAALQALYHQRRKDAASAVLDGSWKDLYKESRGIPSDAEEVWSNILSAPGHEDVRPTRSVLPTDWSLIEPISGDEVARAIKTMANTAPGLDKITVQHLRQFKSNALAAYFNLLLLSGGCPPYLCRSRVTLVPKELNPISADKFRPISVSSMVVRCFHKVLASRWNEKLKLTSLQFAFLRRDGCLEATSLLHALLSNSASTNSDLSLAFIDISKAFDSISHDTIVRSAVAFGAPPPLANYIAQSYANAVAVFPNSEVHCFRGVKQGDPLSPLLFVMAMDEVIRLSMPELGYQFHNTLVDGFAFADDLVLCAENKIRLQEKLSAAVTALEQAGMTVNLQKSRALIIYGDRIHHKTALSREPIMIAGNPITAIGPEDIFMYLGIPFNWRGKTSINHRQRLLELLDEVTHAPLKPYQRMEIVRFYLVPRLTHSLVLSRVHRNTLKRLDIYLRQHVRKWLRLPNDTPTSYFHAKINDGGLGIPSFSSLIPLLCQNRFEKLLATECPTLRNVARDASFNYVLKASSIPVRVQGNVVCSKTEAENAWSEGLYNSTDGRGLRGTASSPLSTLWLARPERVFPRVYIRAIQLRCNLLGTRLRNCRRRQNGQVTSCRANCGQLESLSHILQTCWKTHDARCARHNRIARELAKRLRRLGYIVFEELRIPTTTSFIKPDLIVIREGQATVLDVSVVSDGRCLTVWNEKKQKYGADGNALAITLALRSAGYDIDILCHEPIILSYRGICFPSSVTAMLRLGLPKLLIPNLCLLTLIGSLKVYDTFMQGCWR